MSPPARSSPDRRRPPRGAGAGPRRRAAPRPQQAASNTAATCPWPGRAAAASATAAADAASPRAAALFDRLDDRVSAQPGRHARRRPRPPTGSDSEPPSPGPAPSAAAVSPPPGPQLELGPLGDSRPVGRAELRDKVPWRARRSSRRLDGQRRAERPPRPRGCARPSTTGPRDRRRRRLPRRSCEHHQGLGPAEGGRWSAGASRRRIVGLEGRLRVPEPEVDAGEAVRGTARSGAIEIASRYASAPSSRRPRTTAT